MPSYVFNPQVYKKRISKPIKYFPIILFLIIILLGLAFFLKPKGKSTNFYMVEINHFESYKDALVCSNEIRLQGGAGYIYLDNSYRVFASIYLSKAQAESVKKNLSSTYKNVSVYTIKINNSTFANIRNQQLNASAYLNSLKKLIAKTSDEIIKLDKGEISVLDFQTKLNPILTEIHTYQSDTLNQIKNQPKFNPAIELLEDISKILSTIKTQSSQQIKYSLIKLAVNLKSLSLYFN